MSRATNISPGRAYDKIRDYLSGRDAALEEAIGKLKERHAVATKERVDEIVGQCADPQALLVMLDATNRLADAEAEPELDIAAAEEARTDSEERLQRLMTEQPKGAAPIVIDRSARK